MAALFYGRKTFRNRDGSIVSFGAVRDFAERAEIAFFQDGRWYEAGTGHDIWEDWSDCPEMLPTHYVSLEPLPPPPKET